MKKIPVYIITGFLGSGKTTLIKQLLANYANDKKLAIVQNEFAPHNLDGQELKESTGREFNLLEVNNGSVFCVCLLSDFVKSFNLFIDEYKPDIVFFEASGLSDPTSVGEIFGSSILKEKVYLADSICIVDVTNFFKLEKMQQRMVHQVQMADKIILNKTDLVEKDKEIEVKTKVKSLNPFAKLLPAKYCQVNIEKLFQEIPRGFKMIPESLGKPDIQSIVFKSTKALPLASKENFLKALSEKMIRIKGFIYLDNGNTIAVQFSGSNLEVKEVNRTIKQTELVAMGFEITFEEVKKLYETYIYRT